MSRLRAEACRTVVAIPVRNEEARIGPCLDALARQAGATPDAVLLVLNNCTDGTAGIVDQAAARFPGAVHAFRHDLPPDQANAGCARALAMELAAELAGPHGVLLTTDADGRVAPDWLAANLRALQAGADAVAGRAVIDPAEALLIPQALHDDDARECAYAALLDEIASLLDPDPADPWPRHSEASGASLAVTAACYRQVGGMPRMPMGEDRAFVAALRRHDARLRHAPEAWVTVSGRIEGRAVGGMADTTRRRMSCPDEFLDDRLETAAATARRVLLRQLVRARLGSGVGGDAVRPIADLLGLAHDRVAMLLAGARFGEAWAAIEAAVPSLQRRPILAVRLAEETRAAKAMLHQLRHAGDLTPAGDVTPAGYVTPAGGRAGILATAPS